MPKEFKHIIEKAQRVQLTADEKARGKRILSAFMDVNQTSGATSTLQPFERIVTARSSRFSWFSGKTAGALTGVFAFIIIATGVTAASRTSLPGDALYPVKVGIVEPVQTALTFSSAAQASWQGELAVRRLTESEQLSAKGTITQSQKTALSTDFNKHIEAAGKKLASTDAQSAVTVSGEVEAKLRAHQRAVSGNGTAAAGVTVAGVVAAPKAAALRQDSDTQNSVHAASPVIDVVPAIDKLEAIRAQHQLRVKEKQDDSVFASQAACEEKTGKPCVIWMCDLVPAGKTFEEVCPHGSSYFAPAAIQVK